MRITAGLSLNQVMGLPMMEVVRVKSDSTLSARSPSARVSVTKSTTENRGLL